METAHYVCEDCGYEFAKSELFPDIEDAEVACPNCGGIELQVVDRAGEQQEPAA